MAKKITKTKKARQKQIPTLARVYVTATFNNTLVTVADTAGQTLFAGSAGTVGFKGARKSTPFAAITAVENVARKAAAAGVRTVEVYIKGPGPGRDAAIRALKATGFDIALIADVTPIPHNGSRPKKRRRV